MHPSRRFIQFLYITHQDASEILRKDFKISVSQQTLDVVCSDFNRFKINEYNKRVVTTYLERNGLGTLVQNNALSSLKKISLNKKILYFLNTAIYRGMDHSSIKDLLNTKFSDFESGVLYSEENVEVYASTIMNFSDLSEEEIENFWKENKGLFDYKNEKRIEQISMEAGLMPTMDHITVMKNIQSTMYIKFMEKINSPNADEQKDSLNFGKAAASIAKSIASLNIAEKTNDTFNKILLDFQGGDDDIVNIRDLNNEPE